MKKAATSLALVVLLGVLGCLDAASPAQAGHGFEVSLNRHALHSGDRLLATATAPVTCEWVLEWSGQRRHAVGTQLRATFIAPPVSRPTRFPLHALCVYHQADLTRARSGVDQQMLVVRVPDTWQDNLPVTVVPEGAHIGQPDEDHDPGGDLPDTGGPPRWLVALGAALVLAGAQLVRRSRRGQVPAEPAPA